MRGLWEEQSLRLANRVVCLLHTLCIWGCHDPLGAPPVGTTNLHLVQKMEHCHPRPELTTLVCVSLFLLGV